MIDPRSGTLTLDEPGAAPWQVSPATTLDAFLLLPVGMRSTAEPPFPGRSTRRAPPATFAGFAVLPFLHFTGQRLGEVHLVRLSAAAGWEGFREEEPLLQYRETRAWLLANGWDAGQRPPWGTCACRYDGRTPSVSLIIAYGTAQADLPAA